MTRLRVSAATVGDALVRETAAEAARIAAAEKALRDSEVSGQARCRSGWSKLAHPLACDTLTIARAEKL